MLLGGCGSRSWLPSVLLLSFAGAVSIIKLSGKSEGIRILAEDLTNIRTANDKQGSKDGAIRHLNLKAKLCEVETESF